MHSEISLLILEDKIIDLVRHQLLEKSQMSGVDTDDRNRRKITASEAAQQGAVSADTNDQCGIGFQLLVDAQTGFYQFFAE